MRRSCYFRSEGGLDERIDRVLTRAPGHVDVRGEVAGGHGELTGRTALVTGACNGLGRAIKGSARL